MNGEGQFYAWRFVHPDLDDGPEEPGLQFNVQGQIAMVGGREAVRQSILLLLSTRPGERVMRPTYGCNLHRLVFSPNDDTTAGLALHYVRRALTRWEPRIEIIHLDAGRNIRLPNVLDIYLEYRIRALQSTDALLFSLSLTGDEA
jgi:hypothetical protein